MSKQRAEADQERRPAKKRRRLSISTLLIVALVVLGAAGVGIFAANWNARPQSTPRREENTSAAQTQAPTVEVTPSYAEADSTGEWGSRVRYQGETYVRRDKLQTLLFMGVDNVQYAEQALGSAGRTDTLILFVLDTETKTGRMITISRDTMVDVDVYDDTGRKLFTGEMQITMQYGYGDNPKRCALLTERRVSELIHGIDIDGYLALTMDGIAPIVDGLGGVRLTLDEDYSYIDSSYTKGATVTLNGAAVQRMIRYRDTSVNGSNNDRMARDAWLIQELFHQLRSGNVSIGEILDLADTYMNTDLSAETLRNFARYDLSGETVALPGENRTGDNDEFYVDDEAVQALLIDIFYEKLNEASA